MPVNLQAPRTASAEPRRQLALALRTIDSIQASIRHADTKVGVLLGAQGGMAAAVWDRAPSLIGAADPVRVAAVMLGLTFLVGLALSSWHLAMAMLPRVAGPRRFSRFAFPSLAETRRPPAPSNAGRLCDEAWSHASVLARIAMAKHRRVRRGLAGLAVAAVTGSALLILATIAAAAK
jgi:hypothetical protein